MEDPPRKNIKFELISIILLSTMDLLAELGKTNEITSRILSGKSVSQEDYRYVVMFNLAAMTQLLWELANPGKSYPYITNDFPTRDGNMPLPSKQSARGRWRKKLLPLLAVGSFLAGLGLGYIMP